MGAALKQLDELINREDPGWPVVQGWLAGAKNSVEVLPPPDNATREKVLVNAQVTTRSPMGAIIYGTGGIFVDHGWMRILGSGHPRLTRNLPEWNFGRSFSVSGGKPSFLLIADDVLGGFFAIDGGGLELDPGKVCYFAPDQMAWESTGLGYSDFVRWSFQGDLSTFYQSERWPGWIEDVKALSGDEGFLIYPFLNVMGPPLSERERRPASIAELYDFHVGKLGTTTTKP